MKTQKEIILALANIVDESAHSSLAFEVIMEFAGVEGLDRDTREALLSLADKIHERKW